MSTNHGPPLRDNVHVVDGVHRTRVTAPGPEDTLVSRTLHAAGRGQGVRARALARASVKAPEFILATVDISRSMDKEFAGAVNKLGAAQRALTAFTLNKHNDDPDDAVGLIAFAGSAQLVSPALPLAAHKRDLLLAIDGLTHESGTNIAAPLECALVVFEAAPIDAVLRFILLSDGHDTAGGDALGLADRHKRNGVIIDVIGIGKTPSDVDEELLRGIASTAGGRPRYLFVRDCGTLVTHYTTISGKTLLGRGGVR